MAVSEAPYSCWRSPITSAAIVADSVRLGPPLLDAQTGVVHWVEGRPSAGGRCVLCTAADEGSGGVVVDLSPASLNVRSRVHEYGGGEALVRGGVAYVSHFADQRLYRLDVSPCGWTAVATCPTSWRTWAPSAPLAPRARCRPAWATPRRLCAT